MKRTLMMVLSTAALGGCVQTLPMRQTNRPPTDQESVQLELRGKEILAAEHIKTETENRIPFSRVTIETQNAAGNRRPSMATLGKALTDLLDPREVFTRLTVDVPLQAKNSAEFNQVAGLINDFARSLAMTRRLATFETLRSVADARREKFTPGQSLVQVEQGGSLALVKIIDQQLPTGLMRIVVTPRGI